MLVLQTTIFVSLKVAFLSTLCVLPVALILGALLARKSGIGWGALEAAIMLPIAMPPLVSGYFLLVLLGRQSYLGSSFYKWLGISFSFSLYGAVVASALVSLPLFFRAVKISLASIPLQWLQSAETLGLSRTKIWVNIIVPLAWPGILGGAMLSFARSLGEFGATMMLGGNIPGESQTLSLAIWSALQNPNEESYAGALLLCSGLISILATVGALFFQRVFAVKSET